MLHGFGRGFPGMYDFNGFDGFGGFNWIGGAIMFVGVLLVGLIIYLLVRNNRNNVARIFQNTSSARNILDERLANGEIDVTAYDELSKKIKSR